MKLSTGLPMTPEMRAKVAAQLFEFLDTRTTDLAPEVMEVDRRVYTDPAQAERERAQLFGKVPFVAVHASEVPKSGDFVKVQLPNNEVIVVRQPDMSVRTFVNSCRHRGAKLVNEESGDRRLFTCKYHAWSYTLDGALKSISEEPTFGDMDKSCLGLVEIPTEVRHGFVWVVDSHDAEIDVAEWLGAEMDESLQMLELDGLTCYRVGTFDEPINWKILMDAFLDAYHIASTHAGSVAQYFYNNCQVWQPYGRHGRTISPRKSIDQVRGMSPEEAPIESHVTVAHFFMPNMSMLRQPDHFELLSFMPHPTETGRSRMQIRILTENGEHSDEEKARWDKNWDILMAVLRDEDMVLNRYLQEAVHNKDAEKLMLGRNEIVNQHFHRWLVEALEDPFAQI